MRSRGASPVAAGATTRTATPSAVRALREPQHERAGDVPRVAGERVREKEDAHRYASGWLARTSSSCRRSSRNSARCPAICSPRRPVAKRMLPRMRQVWISVHTAAIAHVVHDEGDQGGDAGDQADREQPRAQHPEQQQRLLAEPQLEPDGEHVQHADRDARQAELRLAGVPRIQRDGNLRDGEALGGGDDDHVAVPVGAHRERVHDLAPVRLHRVEILHRDVEERAAQAIVDARDERLLVLPLLEARHHVGRVVEDRRDEARDVLGLELQVGRIEHQHPPRRAQISGAERIGDARASRGGARCGGRDTRARGAASTAQLSSTEPSSTTTTS